MTYADAIKLIGKPVERIVKPVTVLNVTSERDGGHNVLLAGGACVNLEDFGKMYRVAAKVTENAKN